MTIVVAALFGYLLGSIPFGLLLTRAGGAGDVRAVGSGNIGATNVLRTGRKGLAAATLLLDGIKGLAAVLLAETFLLPGMGLVAGIAAVVGHCFPAWLRFQGGKGVATLMGVAFGFSWLIGLVFAGAWIAGLALSRISSLAGMSAAMAAPLAALLMGRPSQAIALAALALLVIWKHRENVGRLRAGTEPRIGGRK